MCGSNLRQECEGLSHNFEGCGCMYKCERCLWCMCVLGEVLGGTSAGISVCRSSFKVCDDTPPVVLRRQFWLHWFVFIVTLTSYSHTLSGHLQTCTFKSIFVRNQEGWCA